MLCLLACLLAFDSSRGIKVGVSQLHTPVPGLKATPEIDNVDT